MIVTNKKNFSRNFSVAINGFPLDECVKYKYLGVFIDRKLNFKSHIEYICGKISKACGALSKLRHVVSINVLKEVYYALIHSYLRYGIVVWGNAREVVLRPLQNLINEALRIMTFAPFGRIELEPLYEYLKVLKVKEVFLLETGKFMYKMENNLLPVSIGDYFQPRKQNNSGYNLRTRKNTSTAPITYRLISSERSIQYHGANLWKNIPNEIKKCKSFISFKNHYKFFLLNDDEA